jgi:hypothetical protein
MALLKRRTTVPPGGFTYLQTETQAKITGENEDQLIDYVVAHRQYKGLTPTDRETVRKEIERQICVRLSRGDCKSEGPDDPWVPQDGSRPVITLAKVMAFSAAALEFVKSGMKLVPREEALRRAEICKGCPENRAASGCNCGNYHAIIAAAIPAERKIDGLFICWNCGCDLTSKVNLEDSVIIASNRGHKTAYPNFCWQRKILESQAPEALDER